MVYLGTSLAQASMELLVHLERSDVLNSFVKMSVSFDESLVAHIDADDLPSDWFEPSMASSVQTFGDQWVLKEDSVILQVPSAALIGEYNYLFNPAHPEAKNVTMSDILPHNYDPRLCK